MINWETKIITCDVCQVTTSVENYEDKMWEFWPDTGWDCIEVSQHCVDLCPKCQE